MSETRITKRQTVMDYGYRTGQGGDEDAAVFELPNEDIPSARSAVLYLAHTDFEALGSPEQITVTIQPGDLLNVETKRLPIDARALLVEFAQQRIQSVWDDAGTVDAQTLAQNVVAAQEFLWVSLQFPVHPSVTEATR